MEIETLNAINEGMYFNLLVMIKVIMLITVFLAAAGFALYLAGTAWFCFSESRRSKSAPPTSRRASPPNTCKPMPRVPDTPVLSTLVNKPRADARGSASRPCAFLAKAASTPPA
jgi:hypothetical protein